MANARILVIDDEELMREFVVELLERAGHRIDSTNNGADGIALLDTHSYDMVVTDLKMVPMDGVEVVKQVRAKSPTTS